jgi:hypothetical protein
MIVGRRLMTVSPVMLTRGEVTVRGTRMGLHGGVFVHDPIGVMDLPRTGFGTAIWSADPFSRPCWAELSDHEWERLGWTIASIAEA